MLEKELERKCCLYAKKKGYFVQKTQFIAQRGCPDRLFYKENDIFFVEFKTKQGKTSKIQDEQIRRLRLAVEVFVINDYDDFVSTIDKRN